MSDTFTYFCVKDFFDRSSFPLFWGQKKESKFISSTGGKALKVSYFPFQFKAQQIIYIFVWSKSQFYATYKMIVTHCLACSELAGKWIYHNHPFKIIPDAIDFDKFKPNSVIRKLIRKKYCIENKYVIGFCGRISYQKNPA